MLHHSSKDLISCQNKPTWFITCNNNKKRYCTRRSCNAQWHQIQKQNTMNLAQLQCAMLPNFPLNTTALQKLHRSTMALCRNRQLLYRQKSALRHGPSSNELHYTRRRKHPRPENHVKPRQIDMLWKQLPEHNKTKTDTNTRNQNIIQFYEY
jgi:hypothetical protein